MHVEDVVEDPVTSGWSLSALESAPLLSIFSIEVVGASSGFSVSLSPLFSTQQQYATPTNKQATAMAIRDTTRVKKRSNS